MGKPVWWLGVSLGVLFGSGFVCFASNSDRQLQKLYCKIGNDLIKIKKEHPQTQPLVYALLDQFGKYNSVAKIVSSKKGEYKRLLKAELVTTEILKKDISDLSEKVSDMKKVLLVADKKLRKDSEQVNDLVEQKNALAKEKEQLVAQRDSLLSERDSLVQERENKPSRTSTSAPMSPL